MNETNFFVAHGMIQSSLITIRSIACLTPKLASLQKRRTHRLRNTPLQSRQDTFYPSNDTHDLTFFMLNPIFAMHEFTEEYGTVQTEFPPSRRMVDGQPVVAGDCQILGSVCERTRRSNIFLSSYQLHD